MAFQKKYDINRDINETYDYHIHEILDGFIIYNRNNNNNSKIALSLSVVEIIDHIYMISFQLPVLLSDNIAVYLVFLMPV